MSEVKISQLPSASSALLADLIPVVQSGVTKKETVQQIIDLAYSSANVDSGNGTIASSTTVSSGTAKTLGSFTIGYSGLYIVEVVVAFGSSATGYRDVEISGVASAHITQQAANGAATRLQIVGFATSSGTVTVTAKHTANADLSVTANYRYIGLKTL